MKKFKTVMCWILFVLAFAGLTLATYFTSTGVNEWWNANVSSWVGGASLAVASTTVIQMIVNYASKSNLDLGIKDFSRSAKEFISAGQESSESVKEVLEKLDIKEQRLDDLILKYSETLLKLGMALDKLDLILENEKEIANHDEAMIKDGTTTKLNANIAKLENKNYKLEYGVIDDGKKE